MRAILWAEFRQVLRRPTMYLLMLFLTVLFAAAFGQQVTQDRTVPVFSEEMDQEEVDRMVERLSGYEPASFEAVEADEALRKIDAGEADIALELTEEGYRLLATDRATDVSMVEQLVRGVLEQQRWISRAAERAESTAGESGKRCGGISEATSPGAVGHHLPHRRRLPL